MSSRLINLKKIISNTRNPGTADDSIASSLDNLSESKYCWLISGLMMLGLVIRFWGIWSDYPHSYYPDEAHFVKRALSFGSGDFNPHWFHKPAFYMYLLFIEYGIFYVVGKLVNLWESVHQFAIFYFSNQGPFYLIGRITTALFSVGTVLISGMMAKKYVGRTGAIFSMGILTLSYGLVSTSKYVKADTPCMFFTTVSLFFLLQFLDSGRKRNLFLSAVFAGIGTATKYYSMVLQIPIFISILFFYGKRGFNLKTTYRVLAVALTAIIIYHASFFVFSPFSFIDPLGRESAFRNYFRIILKASYIAGIEIGDKGIEERIILPHSPYTKSIGLRQIQKGVSDYLARMREGLGTIVMLLSVFGVLDLTRRKTKNGQLATMLAFLILFVFGSILINPGNAAVRYQIVIYPVIAIFAGQGLILLFQLLENKVLSLGLALTIVMSLIYPSFLLNAELSKKDTRNLAAKWIEEHIAAGTKLLVDENGPPLKNNSRNLEMDLVRSTKYQNKGQFTTHYYNYINYQIEANRDTVTFDIFEIRFPWWKNEMREEGVRYLENERDKDMGNPLKAVGVDSYENYLRQGYRYAIVQSERYNRFLIDNKASENFPAYRDFYRELFERGTLIKEFKKHNGKLRGPVVKVFRLE